MDIRPACKPVRKLSQSVMFRSNRKKPCAPAETCGSLREKPATCGPPGGYGKPCVCPNNPCCPPRECARKMRYVQPARPKSFAPRRAYKQPDTPFSQDTIYKKSYLPSEADRPDAVRPKNNIFLSADKFSKETIQKLSYQGHNGLRPEPILPCNHDLLGKGPMQEITTQRHDFVPKPFSKTCPIPARPNIFCNPTPLSDKTTNRLSYMPVDGCQRVDPIRPTHNLHMSDQPFENHTVQKMSYQPCQIPEKEFYPWAQKPKYCRPDKMMSSDTIYKKSYIPNCCFERVEAIRPDNSRNPMTDGRNFDDNTVYHMSYQPNDGCYRPDKIVPPGNITMSCKKMESNTVNKMSYQPNPGFRPSSPIYPCEHKLLGEGPMQEITTQRHDYVPKPICKIDPIPNKLNITLSDKPLSDLTINRLSYQPNACYELREPILPKNELEKACGPISNDTVHRMSFQPVEPLEKMDMPWAKKPAYCRPTKRFAEDTIYKMSYDVPGEFVEDDDCGCHCAMPNECCPCPA